MAIDGGGLGMIRATLAESAEIEAFLLKHAATSMFPLSNLRRHGMAGGHPRAVSFWINRTAGRISDVLTISDEGMVFPQCPSNNWNDVASALRDRRVAGVIGDADQVTGLRKAAGLTGIAELDTEEPSYVLALEQLGVPDVTGMTLHPLQHASVDMMVAWRAAYGVEVLAMTADEAVAHAETAVVSYIANDSHRVLFHDDMPVAMTGFNAVMPEAVQIGGVFVPSELRGHGYASAALALQLAEAMKIGVRTAFLCAASPYAARAYENIGFRRDGSFSMVHWKDPQVPHG